MSGEALSQNPEVRLFSGEAVNVLEELIWRDIEPTGHKPQDESARHLQKFDQSVAAELEGTDLLYIGHTNKARFWGLCYEALVEGYDINSETMASTTHNFLWDEIAEFYDAHHDLSRQLSLYGYNGKLTATRAQWVGSYVIPKSIVSDVLEKLYERGQGYRLEGMGFPWISDSQPPKKEAIQE